MQVQVGNREGGSPGQPQQQQTSRQRRAGAQGSARLRHVDLLGTIVATKDEDGREVPDLLPHKLLIRVCQMRESQCQHDSHDQESHTSEEIGADGYEAGSAFTEVQANV